MPDDGLRSAMNEAVRVSERNAHAIGELSPHPHGCGSDLRLAVLDVTIDAPTPIDSTPGVCAIVPLSKSGDIGVATLTLDRERDWEAYVDRHTEGTIFHSLGWRNAVRDAFGHRDLYIVAMRGERMVGVFPLFLVASRIAGRMLVSVPCGVGGGMLADDNDVSRVLALAAERLATEHRCRVIDVRSERAAVPRWPIVGRYVGFSGALPDRPEDVLARLPRKARAAARNARDKYKLNATFDSGDLRLAWELYTKSMRRLASLNYPFRFFSLLAEQFRDRHWVTIVRQGKVPVAGLVTFLFRDRVMPYFVGMTDEAKRFSAANFIYLCVMERGAAEGFRVFDFGRSRRDNTGSYDFKRFHGFEPRPLGYQQFVPPGCRASNLSPDNPTFALARRVWPHLPLFATRIAGAYLTRHIPG